MMPERIEPPDDELEQLRSLGPVVPPRETVITPSRATPTSTVAIGSNGATLRYKFASEVSIEPPKWEWDGWLVYKAVQLLIGRQGAGKTTWASHPTAACGLGARGQLLPATWLHTQDAKPADTTPMPSRLRLSQNPP